MKLLDRNDIYKINEAAVDWNDSIAKKILGSPFRWIQNISASSRIDALAMQWGAEYALAIGKVLKAHFNEEEEESEPDTTPQNSIYDEENKKELIIDCISYANEIKPLISGLNQIIDQTEGFDTLTIQTYFHKLKIESTIKSKRYNRIFEALINYRDDGALKELTDNIAQFEPEIKKVFDIVERFNNDSNKDLLHDVLNACEEYYKFVIMFIEKLKKIKAYGVTDRVKEEPKKDNKETSETDNVPETNKDEETKDKEESIKKVEESIKYSIGIIREAIFNSGKVDIPSDVRDLMSEELLEKAKDIPNVKQQVSDNLNYARLNTIRYEAAYIIENVTDEKNKRKLQHKFDKSMLNANDYFQEVVDTNTIMRSVTGRVDAEIEKTVVNRQSELNDIQNMGITDVKVDSKFKSNEVYGFHVSLKGNTNNQKTSMLFLSPIASGYNSIVTKTSTYFVMKYLGVYSYDKKSKSIEETNPIPTLFTSPKLKSYLERRNVEIKYIAINGLQASSTKYTALIGISDNGVIKFINGDDLINVTNINDITFDEANKVKDNLSYLVNINSAFNMIIKQRYIIPMESIDAKLYPNLSKKSLKSNNELDAAALGAFKNLINRL